MTAAPPATNGHTGIPPVAAALHVLAAAGGPGVPDPGVVNSNAHDPVTTWPSADVTR